MIGATNAADEGVWLWVDGSRVDLQIFDNDFVPAPAHNCALYGYNFLHNIKCTTVDADADAIFYYICEFEFDVQTDVQTTTDVQTDVQKTTDVQTDIKTTTDVQTTSSQTKHVTCTRSIANQLGKF